MKHAIIWDVAPCGSCDVSEESIVSIIRVKIIGELETTLAVTSNSSVLRLPITANVFPSLPILVTLRFLQEPHSVTSQKTAFLIIFLFKSWATRNLITIKTSGILTINLFLT
jgi:hypothetical protein